MQIGRTIMVFKLWSVLHFLYMLSPFAIFFGIYFLVRKRSEKTKYIVGAVLGTISVFILVIRNVDIFVRQGWGVEVIPLQVCHIGSLIAGIALLTKNRCLIATSFCFNMLPAFLAMLFADALANYDTILKIRPQTYIWGHIFIIVCALYGVFVIQPKFNNRDLLHSLAFIGTMSIIAIICNSAFRACFAWEPNYFYLYNYKGTPLKFLYEAFPSSTYGWFSINWFYTLTLFTVFTAVFIGLFFFTKWVVKKINR
ncbi:MAG: hypothetical protein E7377_01710 [Clostridiales bacterium]|nr:hypothetical protein [Clostridiales bacterium]